MLPSQYVMYLLCRAGMPRRQRGATLIEYVLIVAVIAIAVFAASQAGLVGAIQGVFSSAEGTLTTATGTAG